MNADWISVEIALPAKNMKVYWLQSDGTIDVGFYYADDKSFATWDKASSSPITHWKPFDEQEVLP